MRTYYYYYYYLQGVTKITEEDIEKVFKLYDKVSSLQN